MSSVIKPTRPANMSAQRQNLLPTPSSGVVSILAPTVLNADTVSKSNLPGERCGSIITRIAKKSAIIAIEL